MGHTPRDILAEPVNVRRRKLGSTPPAIRERCASIDDKSRPLARTAFSSLKVKQQQTKLHSTSLLPAAKYRVADGTTSLPKVCEYSQAGPSPASNASHAGIEGKQVVCQWPRCSVEDCLKMPTGNGLKKICRFSARVYRVMAHRILPENIAAVDALLGKYCGGIRRFRFDRRARPRNKPVAQKKLSRATNHFAARDRD